LSNLVDVLPGFGIRRNSRENSSRL